MTSASTLLKDFEYHDLTRAGAFSELSTSNTIEGINSAYKHSIGKPSIGTATAKDKKSKRPTNTRPKGEPRTTSGKRNKQRAFRQLSDKFRQKLLVAQVRLVPTLIAPTEALARLREGRLSHPLYILEGPIHQHLRGYLNISSTNPGSMWQESRSVPSELSPSDVFNLHDLEQGDVLIDDTVLYMSSDTGTAVGDDNRLDESFDSSILEIATHVVRSPSHVSNSFYEDTIKNDSELIVISDYEENDISISENVSENESLVAETPQYAASIISSPSAKDVDITRHSPVQDDSHYLSMKMNELRGLLKTRGIKATGRTKRSVIELLILHDEGSLLQEPTATASSPALLPQHEIEDKLTDFIRTEPIAKLWWEKILCYEPIVIESFHKFLYVHSGIMITLPQLKQFCDNNGICFTAADDRRARKKK